jgi:hypothetical protein
MNEIQGKARTVRELLKGVKYSIDYYQREFRWGQKQILELLNDLTGKFLEQYDPRHSRKEVEKYPHYFLGSIIISSKDSGRFIVDGQQRLTSLTLLLVLLRNLQRGRGEQVNIDELIFSEKYGEKSFNLDVPERETCLNALFDGQPFDPNGASESVRNIYERFNDLEENFPDELQENALPYFIDWLLENVHLVEITAYSDDDAYTIFETMNDRGLSLTPTEMLKGYLLANTEENKRDASNRFWRLRLEELAAFGKDVESDFFKNWLRSQYATKIRERKKGAIPEDFDRIGTEYHRWVRESAGKIGLTSSDRFWRFIHDDFDFFSRQYRRLMQAASGGGDGLEHVMYNADQGFTLQYMLLLAPLKAGDTSDAIDRKLRITTRYVDILLAWRIWNFRSIAYSTMQYAMFLVMRDIRGLDVPTLARTLHDRLLKEEETFSNTPYHRREIGLYLHQQNRRPLHRLLARLTDYIETQSGMSSRYREYVRESGRNRFEVEHIWADKFEYHKDEFAHPSDFQEHRNRFGGLLLLPKSFNASYGDLPYEAKIRHYLTQNLLARTLHPQCYERNPGFMRLVERSGLPIRPIERFDRAALDERCDLYRRIAGLVWNPEDLLREAES